MNSNSQSIKMPINTPNNTAGFLQQSESNDNGAFEASFATTQDANHETTRPTTKTKQRQNIKSDNIRDNTESSNQADSSNLEAPNISNLSLILKQIGIQSISPSSIPRDLNNVTNNLNTINENGCYDNQSLLPAINTTVQDMPIITNQIELPDVENNTISQLTSLILDTQQIKGNNINKTNVQVMPAMDTTTEPTQTISDTNSLLATTANMPLEKFAVSGILNTPLVADTDNTITDYDTNQVTQTTGLTNTITSKNTAITKMEVQVPLDHPEWGTALHQKIVLIARENIQEASIQISPPDLGPVVIKLALDGERVHVQFTTQHSEVRDIINANMHRLKEMFSSEGLSLGDTSVSHHQQQPSQQGSTNQEHSDSFEQSFFEERPLNGKESIATSSPIIIQKIGLLDEFA